MQKEKKNSLFVKLKSINCKIHRFSKALMLYLYCFKVCKNGWSREGGAVLSISLDAHALPTAPHSAFWEARKGTQYDRKYFHRRTEQQKIMGGGEIQL